MCTQYGPDLGAAAQGPEYGPRSLNRQRDMVISLIRQGDMDLSDSDTGLKKIVT